MIYFECFLTYFLKFPVISDKKELRFGQNFNKLYSPKIQLDLTYIFSHRLFLYLHPKVFTKWHDFHLKQSKTKQTNKNLASQGRGAHPLRHPLCAPVNHSLMSKPDPRLFMPIKKPISEHNECAFTIRPNIILYRTISNDFAEKLVLKMKEKLCEERRFGVLKTLKTQELPGALPPRPRRGVAPGPHLGPLSGPLDSTPLRCSVHLDTNYFLLSTPQ